MLNIITDLLLVDSCAHDRALFRFFLSQGNERKYVVREVASAAEAFAAIAERTPDCVLLEYRLPDNDGLSVLRELAAHDGIRFPIVMMTGTTDTSVSTAALAEGAQECLSKSRLTRDMVEQAIEHAMLRVRLAVNRQTENEAALAAANRELHEFALMAAHDLQAPLRTIKLFIELLERYVGSQPDLDAKEAAKLVRALTVGMQTMIRDMLLYARYGSAQRGQSQAISLRRAVQQAVDNLKADIQTTGATVMFDDLPPVQVRGEEIVRVLQNLIGNALKHRGFSNPPFITVSCSRRQSDWLVEVHDNGAGFAMSEAEAIFKPFRRLGGYETPGSGLGLAICRRIIECAGGRIWADAEAGKGATFYFTLPLSSADGTYLPVVAANGCSATA